MVSGEERSEGGPGERAVGPPCDASRECAWGGPWACAGPATRLGVVCPSTALVGGAEPVVRKRSGCPSRGSIAGGRGSGRPGCIARGRLLARSFPNLLWALWASGVPDPESVPGCTHLPASLVLPAAQLGKKVAVVDYVEPSPRGRQPPPGAVCPGEGVGGSHTEGG